MTRALEDSLRRLRTDYLDLYWVHWPDFVTPSTRSSKPLRCWWTRARSCMPDYPTSPRGGRRTPSVWPASAACRPMSLAYRASTASSNAVPTGKSCRWPRGSAGAVLYSPLGGGLLTGKYRASDEGRLTTLGAVIQREDTDQKTAVVDAVLRVASDIGCTPGQVALAWELERGRRSSTAVVPIIGPRTPAQLDEYLGALDVTLDEAQHRLLTDVSAPELGAPHDDAAAQADSVRGGVGDRFVLGYPVP